MPSPDSYNKIITALQNARPALHDAPALTNAILTKVEKGIVDKEKSRVYYMFRNVTVSAAAMLAGVFLYQTFLFDEKLTAADQGISINVAVPETPPGINRDNLVQSLIAYIQEQKIARDKYKQQVEDYTLNLINRR